MLPAQSFTRNLILSRLDPEDYGLLQPDLERIDLTQRLELVGAGKPIPYVHFPEGGVVSVVADTRDATIEVGLVGREGLTGATVLLGTDASSDRSFVQIDQATARVLREVTLETLLARKQARDNALNYQI